MIQKYEEAYQYLLNNNISLVKLCEMFHIGRGHFTKQIKELGFEVHNYQNESCIDESIFEQIDTEEKAYWLGFLYADGYVAKDGFTVSVSLKEEDRNHLYKFKRFLNVPNKVGFKKVYLHNKNTGETKEYPTATFSINRKKIHEDLIAKGCVPQKTFNLKFPSEDILPKDLVHHFVRGFVDGDGWVGIGIQSRGARFSRLNITCASIDFLNDLVDAMGWEHRAIHSKQNSKAVQMEWGSYKTFEMLKDMYEDATVYLDRKYQKYLELKEIMKLKNAVLNQTE